MNTPVAPGATVGARDLSRLVTTVFVAWHKATVPFVVLRNYENLPAAVGNDIDILVGGRQLALAERVLVEAAKCAGYRFHNRAEFSPVSLFFFHQESLQQVQVDLFAHLRWRGFTLFPVEEVLARRVERDGFAVPHPAHEAAINLVTRLIYSGYVKDNYRAGIASAFRAHADVAERLLADAFGRGQAQSLVRLARAERWGDIERKAVALRLHLIARQLVWHLFRTLKGLTADIARLTRRFLRPPGVTIVLIGPDGSGKSTVASLLTELLNRTFSPEKGLDVHWKPVLFFPKRRQSRSPTTDPHGQPPRGRVLSFCFLAYHWVEFLLGALLQIRPVRFRNGLVIADRYHYDFLADQRRYRLNVPPRLVQWACALLPKPDMVFLLDAPPEVVQKRKREVPFAEAARQCAAYHQIVAGLPNAVIIDAKQPAENAAVDVEKAVLEFMARRMPGPLGKRGAAAPEAETR